MSKAVKTLSLALILFSTQSFSHPGRTSKDGCHFCRSNCKKWEFTQDTRHGHNGEKCDSEKGKIDPLYGKTGIHKTDHSPSDKSFKAYEKSFSGKVVAIKDGDTIDILKNDSKLITIRLYGVDSPEVKKGQPYNQNAKKFTSDFCFGKTVDVKAIDVDQYGRLVAVIKTNDGKNLNQSLVESGFAWVYTVYCKAEFCSKWSELESTAKIEKRGLWQEKSPIAPWEWRKK